MIAIFAYWVGMLCLSLVLSLCVLFAGAAMAQETTYGAHVGSAHSERGFNNFNPGAYVVTASGLIVGGYYNSERRGTLYAGKHWQGETFGVTAALITGYRRGPFVGVVPSARIGLRPGMAARVAFVPKIEKGGAAALHFSLEVTR